MILCEYLMRGTFSGWWSLPKILSWYFDKCRRGYPYICLREQHRITMCSASHIQQSRYISHFRSRNRGAMTLLQQYVVKKIASKESSGKAGVQPVCGRQVRREKWPIMILLEISQHAVVEVRFLWCLSAFYGRNRRQSGLTAQGTPIEGRTLAQCSSAWNIELLAFRTLER